MIQQWYSRRYGAEIQQMKGMNVDHETDTQEGLRMTAHVHSIGRCNVSKRASRNGGGKVVVSSAHNACIKMSEVGKGKR